MSMRFKATAYTGTGERFVFHFRSTNWNGVVAAASLALDDVIAADPLLQKHSDWMFCDIDIA